MRDNHQPDRFKVASLKELDALVGRYLTKETPQVFWEEQQVCLRFDSLEEALEAMKDPYFREFIPKDVRPQSVLTEIQEFRAYSSDLATAWEVVEKLSSTEDAFRVRRENGHWVAAFGDRPSAASRSAPVAICLAALHTKGIDVELMAEKNPSEPGSAAAS